MRLTQIQIQSFQKEILSWYKKNKRDLPWRHTRDPYKILISEVMSQQTQLSRVMPKYTEWLKAFPDLESLAKASTRDVLLHWSGLGYNRRALYLHRLAQIILTDLHGEFPRTEKELRQLPGIGEYTARAILCLAFNEQVAVVDTNVRKVILTKFQNVILSVTKDLDSSATPQNDRKIIQEIADQLLPKGKAYDWNQALMDYAAAELKHHKISIPKQSRFKDSDRYYRGQIVKLLLAHNKIPKNKLYKHFISFPTMSQKRFNTILLTLLKDNLISQKEETISLIEEVFDL